MAKGLQAAETFIAKSFEIIPTANTLQKLHKITFREVYPFAGSFREPQHRVAFGPEQKWSGAYSPTITNNLGILRNQSLELFRSAVSKEEKAQAISFYHTQLHFIHPFRDGNSRVALTITAALANEHLSQAPVPTLSREVYYQTRTLAQEEGFLRPFAKHVLGVRLEESLSHTPHEIKLQPYVVTDRLSNGLHVSIDCQNAADVRNWQREVKAPTTRKLFEGHKDGDIISHKDRELLIHKSVEDRYKLLENKKKPEQAHSHDLTQQHNARLRIK